MKKPHRRVHLLMWVVIAPVALGVVIWAATALQPSPTTVEALPAVLEGNSD